MKKYWKIMGLVGLMAGVMTVAGCGGGGGSDTVIPPRTQSVTGAGSDNASDTNVTYNVGAGDYTYTIAGFSAGDKIVLPAGTAFTVDNTNTVPANAYTDGQVTLVTVTTSGAVVKVVLTGLTNTQDQHLNFPNDLNTMFGAGTVTQN